ncbi:MAG: 16S rRNA (guanine(527)-N(7))-methyltransferase RsmG [candidate division KSB1 bacterium]|nr:16S rRNA (guanine(527)-N(7))-methyltransferase RsmG [candidate division KSB1 bacterium]MDZ7335277.1 16S rRNA (guanine(527)-N(7))-methyltransferase RsmG [candidate division KSB1 bacterium]MDZ7358664.1 16S rRNA (guanine(527)-N(7))-methyltransferase RsmG [candidate division KSB1 bacterium]MDZ7399814.1 16S rRNA (guanine(527)-N(7))-methyltransferase RsmG [candidate division KSB1 bacterium]
MRPFLSAAGILVDEDQERLFQQYIELLLDWNKRTNLISRKDESHIVEHHLFESLACLLSVKFLPGQRIVDVGSGAGFPAIPLAIMCPENQFLLIESKRMRMLFLKEVIFQLNLNNAEVIGERVEHIASMEDYQEKFDIAISRAVASLVVVYQWVKNLIKPGGYYLAWKGGDVRVEIEQLIRIERQLSVEILPMNAALIPPESNKLFVQVNKQAL